MNNRLAAFDKIKTLFLAALLLVSTNVIAQERKNATRKNTLALTTRAAPVLASAARFLDTGLIAFSTGEHIYVMNTDGSNIRRVTDETPGARNTYPALSPDAKRIAFIRDEGLGEYTLYVIGIDGNNLQLLTTNLTPLGEPAWSPDGSKIAFIQGYDPTVNGLAGFTGCSPEIYVIDVASGKEENLTQGAGGTDPAWSPDGTRIAFSSLRDGNYEIYTMASNGADIQRLTDTEWLEAEPSWSPDGRRIAYASHLSRYSFGYGFDCGFMPTGGAGGGDTNEVTSSAYIMNADGTDQTILAGTTGTTELSWSPSGAWLTLSLNLWGDSQIYVVDAWGRNLTKLTSDPVHKSSPSWRPSLTAAK